MAPGPTAAVMKDIVHARRNGILKNCIATTAPTSDSHRLGSVTKATSDQPPE